MSLRVAVVVVTYNSADHIDGLLDSLPAALDGTTAEVVVVDNGSSDTTVELLRLRSGCTVVESVNDGYSAGINRGIRAAGPASAVLVLNPDVRLDPGSVRVLLDTLERDGIGIVAPRVRSPEGELHLSLRREPTLLRALGLSRLRHPALSEYVQEPAAYEREHAVDWALGAVLAMSRECLDAVGEWDESFFLYSEETDFCLRARDLGYRTWYVPSSGAVHIGGGSGQSDLTHTLQIVNRVRLYARRRPGAAAWCYYALTILSEGTWVVRGHRQSRAAIAALLRPSRRPEQLGRDHRLLPS